MDVTLHTRIIFFQLMKREPNNIKRQPMNIVEQVATPLYCFKLWQGLVYIVLDYQLIGEMLRDFLRAGKYTNVIFLRFPKVENMPNACKHSYPSRTIW